MKMSPSIILTACLLLATLTSLQKEVRNGFFLSQFFYLKSIANNSKTKTEVNIVRIDVWITNRTNTTSHVRNIIGFLDLGEAEPYSTNIVQTNALNNLPRNEANDLYHKLTSKPLNRLDGRIIDVLTGTEYNLIAGQDFQKVYARKLSKDEFTFDSRLGNIWVNAR